MIYWEKFSPISVLVSNPSVVNLLCTANKSRYSACRTSRPKSGHTETNSEEICGPPVDRGCVKSVNKCIEH